MDVNYKKAIKWYEKAAEQGDAGGQFNLGGMYYHGHGADVNYKKAIEWWEKAAEQGHAHAQFNLGCMYNNGVGVDQSDSMAMRWYAKADAQGEEQAQVAIRKLVSKRRGSPAATSSSSGAKKWEGK